MAGDRPYPGVDLTTVETLRTFLATLPGEMEIFCQVVGQDRTAWTMMGEVAVAQSFKPPALVVSLSNLGLRTLPDVEFKVEPGVADGR